MHSFDDGNAQFYALYTLITDLLHFQRSFLLSYSYVGSESGFQRPGLPMLIIILQRW